MKTKNLCIWVHSTVYIDKYIFFFWSGQIWRPITATFFFPVGPGTGFLYLVNLYFLYQYSSRLETGMLSMKFYVHGELCLESTETKYCQIDLLGVFVVMGLWLIQTESWERWLISVPTCVGQWETALKTDFLWVAPSLCQGACSLGIWTCCFFHWEGLVFSFSCWISGNEGERLKDDITSVFLCLMPFNTEGW